VQLPISGDDLVHEEVLKLSHGLPCNPKALFQLLEGRCSVLFWENDLLADNTVLRSVLAGMVLAPSRSVDHWFCVCSYGGLCWLLANHHPNFLSTYQKGMSLDICIFRDEYEATHQM
jgi:hypothetical protein